MVKGYCIALKQKNQPQKIIEQRKNGELIKNEGENEEPGTESDLKQ